MGQALRRVYPESSYWLPAALIKNQGSYQLEPKQERVEGQWCHIISRRGLDKIWVQSEAPHCWWRRQFHWGEGKSLRQDITVQEFEEVKPRFVLPKRMVFVRYTAPWDEPEIVGQPASRIGLEVSHFSVEPLPEKRFRVQIPPGTEVTDFVRGDRDNPIRFISTPAEDPFDLALEGRTFPSSGFWRVFLVVTGFVGGLLLFWWVRRRRAASA